MGRAGQVLSCRLIKSWVALERLLVETQTGKAIPVRPAEARSTSPEMGGKATRHAAAETCSAGWKAELAREEPGR